MPEHNDLADALLECLGEVSSLLICGDEIARKQRDALVANDAEAITATYKAQEDTLRRIGESDQRAASLAERLAESAGIDPPAGIEQIADAAGYPYGDLIRAEIGRISALADKCRESNLVNQQLLKNGLDIIASCFRTIVADSGPQSYSRDAGIADSTKSALSVDLKA